MSVIDLNSNARVANEEMTRTTVANVVTMARAVITNLIGKDLARSDGIDLEKHLSTIIGNEINKQIEAAAGAQS